MIRHRNRESQFGRKLECQRSAKLLKIEPPCTPTVKVCGMENRETNLMKVVFCSMNRAGRMEATQNIFPPVKFRDEILLFFLFVREFYFTSCGMELGAFYEYSNLAVHLNVVQIQLPNLRKEKYPFKLLLTN